MKQIKVDSINLRLRGISPQVARSAMSGLSDQIQDRLTRHEHLGGATGTRHISQIRPGPFQIQTDTNAAELRQKIAVAIAASINKEST
jgi:hypothetical protein